ncbi:hypothetical protein GCM10010279_12730 [Streptomyces mutabilis]|nr:hypothetical protein GCM10010279_12730 [Streptomyces mutabilis]
MTVVDSTFAEPARAVARSTACRGSADGSADALESLGPPTEVQAVTQASAAVTAIDTAVRRAVVLLIRPPPVPPCTRARVLPRTLTQSCDTRTEKGTGPAPRKVRGP